MSRWIALSRTQHADKYFWPRQGYAFAAREQVVPVLLAELVKLLPYYVLGFVRQGENYQAVALTGLGGERNLYLHSDGPWLASYLPANLRAYPFSLAKAEGQQVLCIEQDSLTEEPSAQPLFDDEGNLAQRVKQGLGFLTQCDKNRQLTDAACQVLDENGLIEPWPLQVERGEEQEPLKVQGLYRIDEKALNELVSDSFAEIRSHGALPLAYAQIFSLHQLGFLGERAKFHANQQAAQPENESIDSLLEGGDDDFSFDFGD